MANETRLIDANPLIEMYSGGESMKSISESIHDEGFVNALRNAPTVDAVEVVHGRWIVDRKRLTATCSECGKKLHFSDEMQILFLRDEERFCYYCGAKMDLED